MALEASGDSALMQTLRCLAPFGRLVVYGAAKPAITRTIDGSPSESEKRPAKFAAFHGRNDQKPCSAGSIAAVSQ